MMNQRRIFSGLMAAALFANTVAPAYAESGADSSPSLPTTPTSQQYGQQFGQGLGSDDDLNLPELFFLGVIALGGGRNMEVHFGVPPKGEYDPAGAARDRGEQPPPPPPPATPATATVAPTPEQAAQQQLAGWKADLEKKIADPKTSPQGKQVAQNKLAALNQYGNMQQTDAAAAGSPGGR